MESLSVVLLVEVALAAQLMITQSSSSSTVERSDDHWCGNHRNKTVAPCDPGRCCSHWGYCGDGLAYCGKLNCHKYCPPNSDLGAETAGTLVVTAMHNDYLDHGGDDHDHVIEAATINASSSIFSSLSCAASLSSMSSSSLSKYPWVVLRVAVLQNGKVTTYCGRCFKVTNFGVGGVHREAKVRVVHESNDEGLELDRLDTFHKLDIDGTGGNNNAAGRLVGKYMFEGC